MPFLFVELNFMGGDEKIESFPPAQRVYQVRCQLGYYVNSLTMLSVQTQKVRPRGSLPGDALRRYNYAGAKVDGYPDFARFLAEEMWAALSLDLMPTQGHHIAAQGMQDMLFKRHLIIASTVEAYKVLRDEAAIPASPLYGFPVLYYFPQFVTLITGITVPPNLGLAEISAVLYRVVMSWRVSRFRQQKQQPREATIRTVVHTLPIHDELDTGLGPVPGPSEQGKAQKPADPTSDDSQYVGLSDLSESEGDPSLGRHQAAGQGASSKGRVERPEKADRREQPAQAAHQTQPTQPDRADAQKRPERSRRARRGPPTGRPWLLTPTLSSDWNAWSYADAQPRLWAGASEPTPSFPFPAPAAENARQFHTVATLTTILLSPFHVRFCAFLYCFMKHLILLTPGERCVPHLCLRVESASRLSLDDLRLFCMSKAIPEVRGLGCGVYFIRVSNKEELERGKHIFRGILEGRNDTRLGREASVVPPCEAKIWPRAPSVLHIQGLPRQILTEQNRASFASLFGDLEFETGTWSRRGAGGRGPRAGSGSGSSGGPSSGSTRSQRPHCTFIFRNSVSISHGTVQYPVIQEPARTVLQARGALASAEDPAPSQGAPAASAVSARGVEHGPAHGGPDRQPVVAEPPLPAQMSCEVVQVSVKGDDNPVDALIEFSGHEQARRMYGVVFSALMGETPPRGLTANQARACMLSLVCQDAADLIRVSGPVAYIPCASGSGLWEGAANFRPLDCTAPAAEPPPLPSKPAPPRQPVVTFPPGTERLGCVRVRDFPTDIHPKDVISYISSLSLMSLLARDAFSCLSRSPEPIIERKRRLTDLRKPREPIYLLAVRSREDAPAVAAKLNQARFRGTLLHAEVTTDPSDYEYMAHEMEMDLPRGLSLPVTALVVRRPAYVHSDFQSGMLGSLKGVSPVRITMIRDMVVLFYQKREDADRAQSILRNKQYNRKPLDVHILECKDPRESAS